jgi:hypothetical protein
MHRVLATTLLLYAPAIIGAQGLPPPPDTTAAESIEKAFKEARARAYKLVREDQKHIGQAKKAMAAAADLIEADTSLAAARRNVLLVTCEWDVKQGLQQEALKSALKRLEEQLKGLERKAKDDNPASGSGSKDKAKVEKPPAQSIAIPSPRAVEVQEVTREARIRDVQKQLVEAEQELATAEKRDSDNKDWNNKESERLLKEVEKGKAEANRLRSNGETFKAAALDLAARLLEQHARNHTFVGAKETNSAVGVRGRIVRLKQELIDLGK